MEPSRLLLKPKLPDGVQSDRLSHAYIVAGDGTDSLAFSLAAAAVCSGTDTRPCGVCRNCVKAERGVHPDISITEAEPGREIVVDSVRAVRQDASVMPNEAERKAYIIKNADMMNKSAQNAMLKLLEEPPGSAVFILDTQDPHALLETVRSRCVILRTAPEQGAASVEDGAASGGSAELAREFIAAIGGGALRLCEFSFRLDKLDKAGLMAFLDEAERQTVMLLRESSALHTAAERHSRTIGAISRARDYARQNVSSGHVSGMLCAELI